MYQLGMLLLILLLQLPVVGDGVLRLGPPSVLSRVDPEYTDEARLAKVQGTVILEAEISTEGIPTVSRVVRALGYGLDESATRAIEQWRFRPAMRDGQPIPTKLNIEVNFNLASNIAPAPRTIPIKTDDSVDASLQTPHLLSPADGTVFSNFPRMTTLRWEASRDAASYIVEWDFDNNGKWRFEQPNIIEFGFAVTGIEYTFDFVGAQAGRWRVFPVNASGQRGKPSEWRTFRYTQ